jgi:hypothetical protein
LNDLEETVLESGWQRPGAEANGASYTPSLSLEAATLSEFDLFAGGIVLGYKIR